MKRKFVVFLILVFLLAPNAFAAPFSASNQGVRLPGGPEFTIKDVQRNKSVTIRFTDIPKNQKFHVYLGRVGNDFGSGYLVDILNVNRDAITKTYKIPKQLVGQQHIAILVWNKENNHHGYNIFVNEEGFNAHTEWSLYPVHRSSSQTPGNDVQIFAGPEIGVSNVKYPTQFTLAVRDYFDKGTYVVYIGQNNSSFEQIPVGSLEPKNLTFYKETFNIPSSLSSYSELKVVVQNIHTSHSGSTAFTFNANYTIIAPYGYFSDAWMNSGTSSSTSGTPFTNIINVVGDSEVTLQTFNFPPEKEFIVTMGPMGTRGIGGFTVGTQLSGEGGSFIATYPIPAQLKGSDMISIRMASTTSGHFAYDFFNNRDGNIAASSVSNTYSGTTANTDWVLPGATYPNTQIQSVVKDASVTVSGSNFTLNDSYTVRMGLIGSQGAGGTIVGTYNTGSSSSFTATFTIPVELQGSSQIAIRFESNNAPYYAFDWFNNTTYP